MVYAMDVCSILKGKVGGHAARVGMIQLSTRRRAPRKTMGALCQLWEALWPHPCNCDMFWYTDMYTVYICNINIYIYIDYIVIYCVYYDTLWDVRLALFISFHIVRVLKLVRWQVFSLAQMNPTSVSWFYQRLVFHADLQKRGSLSWLEGLQTFAQAHSLQVICKCPHQMLQLFPHQQIVRLNFFVRKATALQIALMQARPALGHQAYWHTRNAVEGTPN